MANNNLAKRSVDDVSNKTRWAEAEGNAYTHEIMKANDAHRNGHQMHSETGLDKKHAMAEREKRRKIEGQ